MTKEIMTTAKINKGTIIQLRRMKREWEVESINNVIKELVRYYRT